MSFPKKLEDHLAIPLAEIGLATNDFKDKIGEGGFGDVYIGKLYRSGQNIKVAVKRLVRSWGQGDHEFRTEISLLSRCRHENLVRLVGFCDESDEKVLVYEYQSNGSLDNYLSNYTTLTWTRRLKICLGAARGLSYLHNDVGRFERVLHRDLKSPNILLDQKWDAKIADFGLSKIGPANQQLTVLKTRVCGTPGYVDPLYFKYGFLSKESDVYSFGVVLFEVLCGRLACFEEEGEDQSLAEVARSHYENEKLDEIVDPNLRKQMRIPDSLTSFASIAYRCLEDRREDRPKMSEIVEALEAVLELQKCRVTTRRELAYQSGYHLGDPQFWKTMLPDDYKQMIRKAVTPNFEYDNLYAVFKIFRSGVLFDEGKRLFRLDSYGENCELISATEFVDQESNIHSWKSLPGIRFPKVAEILDTSKLNLKVHVSPRRLSPGRIYAANLIFRYRFHQEQETCGTTEFITLNYKCQDGSNSSVADLAEWTDEGWLAIELWHFFSSDKFADFEVLLENFSNCINGIFLLGIEYRPLHTIGTGNLETPEQIDENISQLDFDCIQSFVGEKVPLKKSVVQDKYLADDNDLMHPTYVSILQYATNDEYRRLWSTTSGRASSFSNRYLRTYDQYRLLCKGLIFPFSGHAGQLWYSLSKVSGKLRLLLSAEMIIDQKHHKVNWDWKSLPQSRFSSVAELKDTPTFQFNVGVISEFLSKSDVNYACYLVYKLSHTSYGFDNRLKVSCSIKHGDKKHGKRTIHFRSKSPMINSKYDWETYDPIDLPHIKGLPTKRKDGWMEVMLWDFGDTLQNYDASTGFDIKVSTFRPDVAFPKKQRKPLMSGIIVEGVEFRPM